MDWIHEALTAVVEHLLGLTLRQVPKFSHQNCGIDLLWIPIFQLQSGVLRSKEKWKGLGSPADQPGWCGTADLH